MTNLAYENKTLEEIENDYWKNLPDAPTALIKRCYELRKKKLKDFEIEDLRIMIGQNIGLKYLMPIAIDVLFKNPMAEGDYYEGDLLQNVLSVNKKFWADYPLLKDKVKELFESNISLIDLDSTDDIKKALKQAYQNLK